MKNSDLENIFHWIFEKQVESMRYLIRDWDSYKDFSEILWKRYLEFTKPCSNASTTSEDLNFNKYTFGWTSSKLCQYNTKKRLCLTTVDNIKKRINRLKSSREIKGECYPGYMGGRQKTPKLLMENNILLLFLTLSLSRHDNIQCYVLMDILRFANKGDIPFIRMTRFLPSDEHFSNHSWLQSIVLRDKVPSYEVMRHQCMQLAEAIELRFLIKTAMDPLIERLLSDLNLPADLKPLIDDMRLIIEPKMERNLKKKANSNIIKVGMKWVRFKRHINHILFPEMNCIALIFIALKSILIFDDSLENTLSDVAKKFDILGVGSSDENGGQNLFIWKDWLKAMMQLPTVSTAKCWNDINKVRNAEDFLELRSKSVRKFEDVFLYENDSVNRAGRYEQQYKKRTHCKTLEEITSSLKDILPRKCNAGDDKLSMDFRRRSLEYLTSPEEYKRKLIDDNRDVFAKDIQMMKDCNAIFEEMMDLLKERRLVNMDMPLNTKMYSRGIFEELTVGKAITMSERALLETLEYNTGIEARYLYDAITHLSDLLRED